VEAPLEGVKSLGSKGPYKRQRKNVPKGKENTDGRRGTGEVGKKLRSRRETIERWRGKSPRREKM